MVKASLLCKTCVLGKRRADKGKTSCQATSIALSEEPSSQFMFGSHYVSEQSFCSFFVIVLCKEQVV